MGCQSIKVEIEPVTGEERKAAGSQDLSESVDELMGHGLCSGAELKHGKNLGEGINGQPEPEHLCGVAQSDAQFVQLQVWEAEVEKGTLVQGACVLASPRQPGSDRGLPVAEDPFSRGRVQPSASAESTIATCCEGVFRRYKGVWRRALNVVRQA
jgi:hypothetical protein